MRLVSAGAACRAAVRQRAGGGGCVFGLLRGYRMGMGYGGDERGAADVWQRAVLGG